MKYLSTVLTVALLGLTGSCITMQTPPQGDESANTDETPRESRVFFAKAHGEWNNPRSLAKLAKSIGIDFVTSDQPITADSLLSVDVLYILMPTKTFTGGEKSTIVDFVRDGGSLLLVLDEEKRQSLKKTGVNELIAPFGMKLTDDTHYLHNRGAIAQKGVINKEVRELPYSGGRTVKGGTPFSFLLDREGNPTKLAHGAYSETAKGSRIIVLGEGMASLFLGSKEGVRLTGTTPNDTIYWGKDSAVFNREILEWLN